jgi:hypothetical protein
MFSFCLLSNAEYSSFAFVLKFLRDEFAHNSVHFPFSYFLTSTISHLQCTLASYPSWLGQLFIG